MASTALYHHGPAPALTDVDRAGEPLLVLLLVRVQRFALDRRLAAGEDPMGSPELAHRARQITTRRERLALATRVERIVREAGRPSAA